MTKKIKYCLNGASADSFLLIFVRIVTLSFGILTTRILSDHFSVHNYGTYSQILLLATTAGSITILGMMDGLNYFFCREKDLEKKNAYVSTIFFLHCMVSIISSILILLCTVPVSKYFNNPDMKPLMIFAAIIPVLQNSLFLLQVMFVAVGRAKTIAVRNLIVSILKVAAILIACYVFDTIAFLLFFRVLLDFIQTVYFTSSLKKAGYEIHIFRFDTGLIKEILLYCIPMAMFCVVKSLTRDCDKFIISFFTDTETLAVYANASKLLPFDIVMGAFVTVLQPYFTRYISEKKYEETQKLYQYFLEISFIFTAVMAIGAICASPEVMEFLYTKKYLSGVPVFIIYTIIDIVGILNLTFILCAAGKTKTVMYASLGTFWANLVLNLVFFRSFGTTGPALSSLLVMVVQGIVLLILCCREMKAKVTQVFDVRYMLKFTAELLFWLFLLTQFRRFLVEKEIHYFIRLVLLYGLYVFPLLIVNIRRIFFDLGRINACKMEREENFCEVEQ